MDHLTPTLPFPKQNKHKTQTQKNSKKAGNQWEKASEVFQNGVANALDPNEYQALLEIDPQDNVALNNLAVDYTELRQFERAEELFVRALAADTTLVSFGNLAEIRTNLGRFEGAWESVDLMREHQGRLPQDLASRLISECAQALTVVHENGTAHRDIKPANILFDKNIGRILSPEDVAWLAGMVVYRLMALAR